MPGEKHVEGSKRRKGLEWTEEKVWGSKILKKKVEFKQKEDVSQGVKRRGEEGEEARHASTIPTQVSCS